jgi:hypothetical protein
MSANDVQAFDLQGHGDSSLSSWTNSTNYPQLYAQENATQQHEAFTAPIEENRASVSGIMHARPPGDDAGMHDSGLGPALG